MDENGNSMSNIALDAATCPRHAFPPTFYVVATEPIESPCEILAGDHLLIDTKKAPTDGCLALIGERLERWHGQAGAAGVAVEVGRTL